MHVIKEQENPIPDTAQETIQTEIERLTKLLFNQKETIIKDRLKKLGKLNILKNIKEARFKKLIVESHPNAELVYIDNGTLKGHLLVTFLKPKEHELTDTTLLFQLQYY